MKDKKVFYTYKGFYKDSSATFTTDRGQLHAQQALAKTLKAKKAYQVTKELRSCCCYRHERR